MIIEQTVEIPADRRLFIEVPQEVPAGKTILTYTSVPVNRDIEYSQSDKVKAKLQKLQGSLGKNAFGALDGVSYQRKVRKEWDN